jgi:hypothetical protein
MTDPHFIINVGMARSGTTATDAFFRNRQEFAVPQARKELKFFMKHEDPSLADYMSHFNSGPLRFFEASPPYMHGGMARFESCLKGASALVDQGARVTILFCVRSLLKRAFSHYWHDIGSHHAKFGSVWQINSTDHRDRFQKVFRDSFVQQINRSKAKLFPDLVGMIVRAIEVLGSENVRVLQMRGLDAGLRDLLEYSGLILREPITTKRITSAAIPQYFFGGRNGRDHEVNTDAGVQQFHVPKNRCLLFARHHSEVLSSEDFNLGRIVDASNSWSRSFDTDLLPDKIFDYLEVQADGVESLPEEVFLAGCAKSLVNELKEIPERLAVSSRSVQLAELNRLLTKV